MTKIKMDAASIRFFVNPPQNSKEAIFTEAVRRAYSDMSRHTLHYNSPKYIGQSKSAILAREKLREDIAYKFIEEEQNVYSIDLQEKYDKWHKEMCEYVYSVFTTEDDEHIIPVKPTPKHVGSIERKECFSMGQSQKLVNMVWKYVYLFYQYFDAVIENSYTKELTNYSNIIEFLHAPIDSYVTKAVTDSDSKYNLGCKKPDYPWSQLNYGEYKTFQDDIREKLESKKEYPFIWELENFPFNL